MVDINIKTMKMNFLILIVAALFFNQACTDKEENCHKTITFKNKTTDTLFVVGSTFYPDTSIYSGIPNPVLDPNFTKVLPDENNTRVLWGRDCIELDFKDLISSDTLMVYVFDAHVLENTPWDTVKARYLVLKRYDLSLEYLKQSDFTIKYP